MEAREWERAHALLSLLAKENPENILIGSWLQEVELELMAGGTPADPELAELAREEEPAEALRRRYAQRSMDSPSVARFVLAARLETDVFASKHLLERALDLDPDCAWAHYAMAHALLRDKSEEDRWRQARESLDLALANDAGHLGARRLEAWMLVQEGAIREARFAVEAWLEATENDARVASSERIEVELDLALIEVLDGDASDARKRLAQLEGSSVGRARRLSILAASDQAMGDLLGALDAARRAEGATDEGVLPLVQQALLYEYYLGDLESAEAKWEEVIERARGTDDLSTLLQGLRAQVMLERAEARRAEEAGAAAEAP